MGVRLEDVGAKGIQIVAFKQEVGSCVTTRSRCAESGAYRQESEDSWSSTSVSRNMSFARE